MKKISWRLFYSQMELKVLRGILNILYPDINFTIQYDKTQLPFVPQRVETYLLTCASHDDSNQPAKPRSLIKSLLSA